jgi:hypothetical protein
MPNQKRMDHHWACESEACEDIGFCTRIVTCGYQHIDENLKDHYCDCTYDDFDIDLLHKEFCWMHEECAARALKKEDPKAYASYKTNWIIESRLWQAQILLMSARLKRTGDEWLEKFERLSALQESGCPHTALEIFAREWGVKDWELSF